MQKVGHHQSHGHRAGVPTAGAQIAKHRSLGRLIVQMKWLWVELCGKSNDLFSCGGDGAQIALLAGLHVFPVVANGARAFTRHQRAPDTSIKLMVV